MSFYDACAAKAMPKPGYVEENIGLSGNNPFGCFVFSSVVLLRYAIPEESAGNKLLKLTA